MSLKILIKKLYNLANFVNEIFLVISCKINSPYLTSVSWNISLFLLNFKNTSISKKKVLVLYKSFGSDDIEILKKNKKNEFNFFYFPRKNIKIVFNKFFSKIKHDLTDDKYFSEDKTINSAKIEYRNFLKKTVEIFNKKNNFLAVISFNFRYRADKELHLACKLLNIKFIVCQKESLHYNDQSALTDSYIDINSKNGRYNGDYMTVYTEGYKNVLVKASILDSNKIYVVGMPRADYYYKQLDISRKHILYLLPSWKPPKFLEEEFDLKNYSNSITKLLLEFAKKNRCEKIIIKTKMSNEEQIILSKILEKNKLDNVILEKGGNAADLIKDSKLIIGFQSTGLIEAIILRKPIIVPYFNISSSDKFKKCTLRLEDFAYYAYDETSMINYLNKFCSNQLDFPDAKNKKINNIINHYIGNKDGESSRRLLNTFNTIIN
jgi:hypothetical protein